MTGVALGLGIDKLGAFKPVHGDDQALISEKILAADQVVIQVW